MPVSAPTPCAWPACHRLTAAAYCPSHDAAMATRRKATHKRFGRTRRGGTADSGFYNKAAWIGLRARHLIDFPLCVSCASRGITTTANTVDHVQPIRSGGAELDPANLQSLCTSCHNSKTAIEVRARDKTLKMNAIGRAG